MSGFHLRATGNRWRKGIVVIAVVVLVVMKWVDEWPADITLGPEQNIYSRRLQIRERRKKRKGERKIVGRVSWSTLYDDHGSIYSCSSTLGPSSWSLFFFRPSHPYPLHAWSKAKPQSSAPSDYRLPRVAGYIPMTTFPVEFQYISFFLSFSLLHFSSIILFCALRVFLKKHRNLCAFDAINNMRIV